MKTIDRAQVKQMIDERSDVHVVDVLSEESYQQFHLPHAINVPIGERFDEEIQKAVPDKQKMVIVYCKDTECGASPKAARRMEDLGYQQVLDYEAGKEDWQEAGLPIEKG